MTVPDATSVLTKTLSGDDPAGVQRTFEICREIDAWIAAREASAARRDWNRVLGEMEARLKVLWAFPLVHNDPVCQDILIGLTRHGDMEEFDKAMDLLGFRVSELLADMGVQPVEQSTTRFVRRRASPDMRPVEAETADVGVRPARMVLRL